MLKIIESADILPKVLHSIILDYSYNFCHICNELFIYDHICKVTYIEHCHYGKCNNKDWTDFTVIISNKCIRMNINRLLCESIFENEIVDGIITSLICIFCNDIPEYKYSNKQFTVTCSYPCNFHLLLRKNNCSITNKTHDECIRKYISMMNSILFFIKLDQYSRSIRRSTNALMNIYH